MKADVRYYRDSLTSLVGSEEKSNFTIIRLVCLLSYSEIFEPIGKWNTWEDFSTSCFKIYKESGSALFSGIESSLESPNEVIDIVNSLREKLEESGGFGREELGKIGGIYEELICPKDRRKSGSHYTPKTLAREIVEEAFRPWLERHSYDPSLEAILELKVCDPAVGGGIFLLETAGFLNEIAIKVGEVNQLRNIIERCLYGVDKSTIPVEITKLSLWLLLGDRSFKVKTLDAKVVQGDSLVGFSLNDITLALGEVGRANVTDSAYLRMVGDLLVAAFFNGKKPKDREELKQLYLAATLQHSSAEELEAELSEPLERLRLGDKGIQPLHWQLAFPDVFGREQPGFDVFVGNPPFAGKNTIAEGSPEGILDWFKQLHAESHGNADLVAHFFRRCFDLLRPGGSLGLIATNTIAQGDTRSTGLRWICLNGGTIYAARKRCKWPGVAAVVVSVVHMLKGAYAGMKLLENRPVELITAFLLPNGGHEDPKQLAANTGKSFQGSIVLGMGFTFDNSPLADDDTPGVPSPIATMERLVAENPKNAEVIFPYIGGEEVNDSPTHAHHRYVVDFRDRSEHECRRLWPELMQLLEKKVKPQRQERKPNGDFKQRAPLPQKWWIHAEKRPALYEAIRGLDRVLVNLFISSTHGFSSLESKIVFANTLNIFPLAGADRLAILQCRVHEVWTKFSSSTMGDGIRYTPSDCFSPFPFPDAMCITNYTDQTLASEIHSLEAIGEHYRHYRAELMVANDEGLTSTYNRFHDPAETSPELHELRRLHSEMDRAVLNAYGWSDVPIACGFGLDYLDIEEDCQLPSHLQERVDSGYLFFWGAKEATLFENELRKCGAIGKKKKLPWRYRWPDNVRDEVLARLLALNAERYAEEVAQGLHS